jgi:hypothetical protein
MARFLGVSLRTVERSLAFLRDGLGWIEFTEHRGREHFRVWTTKRFAALLSAETQGLIHVRQGPTGSDRGLTGV